MEKSLKEKFNKLYEKLNPEQKMGVDEIEGPIMVIAGPGTGKTHLLTMRIANILDKTDTAPESILALTFTESAVASVRKNLSEIIGTLAYRVNITTFHGFANNIIKEYPDDFPEIIGSTNISDVDQIKIIREIIDNSNLVKLKPFGSRYFYVPSIIHAISDLKQQGFLPEDFAKIIEKENNEFENINDLYYEKGINKGKMKGKYITLLKNIERNKELAIVYKEYRQALRKSNFYDYSDMIVEVKIALENFLYFKNLYKNVKEISLKHNYRSTQTILNASFNIKPNSIKLLSNTNQPENLINIREFSDPQSEYNFLGKDIKQLLDNNHKPEQIAVLYRENRDVFDIARVLRKFGLPFTIESDQDILDDQDIKKLLIILRAIYNFGSDRELIELLYIDIFDIPALDIYKLSSFKRGKASLYDVIKSDKLLKEANIENVEKLKEIYKKLSIWKKQSYNKNAVAIFEDIIRDSGLLGKILSDSLAIEKIQKLGTFFDQIKNLIASHKDYTLDDFFDYLNVIKEHNISIKNNGLGYSIGKVRLMTAHKSKGLEFDNIYITNAQDGHWGGRRNHENIKLPSQIFSMLNKIDQDLVEDDDEDERNLFYVAITRAKKQVTITYSVKNQEEREKLPSIFVQEIKPEFIKILKIENEQISEPRDKMQDEFKQDANGVSNIKEKDFLNDLFIKNGLSVTALNNYLTCPWNYFFNNLLRLPGNQNKFMIFGTAIHEALKNYFDTLKDGKDLKKDYLIRRFRESLNKQPIVQNEYTEMLKKGKEALSGYYDFYHKSFKTNILNEMNITRVELAENIYINGKIDKIEILDSSNNVNVVDYKTGKAKSRNELGGLNKNSTGDYLRQLTFYNLLLNNYQNNKFKMQSGEIDFIQPDEKGNYRKELFTITKEMTNNLENQIKQVAKEILELSFWDKTCNDKKCEFCALRKMIK